MISVHRCQKTLIYCQSWEALAEIHKGAGTHFDPDLARTFLEVITEEDEFFRGTNYQLGGYQKAS